jgi:hypothetical protein
MKILLLLSILFLITHTTEAAESYEKLINTCNDWKTTYMEKKIYYVEGYLVGVLTEARRFKRVSLDQHPGDFVNALNRYCDSHPKSTLINAILQTQ